MDYENAKITEKQKLEFFSILEFCSGNSKWERPSITPRDIEDFFNFSDKGIYPPQGECEIASKNGRHSFKCSSGFFRLYWGKTWKMRNEKVVAPQMTRYYSKRFVECL